MPALVNNTTPITWTVSYRASWLDPWTEDRTLMPVSVVFTCAPTMPTARVIRDYGQVDDLALGIGDQILEPLDLRGYYIRIVLSKEDFEPHTWYGYCPAPSDNVAGMRTVNDVEVAGGRTTYNCYGLEWLLGRDRVLTSIDVNSSIISRAIPFNYVDRSRFSEIKGNRSAATIGGGIYAFDAAGVDTWTGLEALEHLLAAWTLQTGGKLDWYLSAAGDLANILEAFDFQGMTYYDAIRRIINPANGKTFYLTVEPGDKITINVVSIVSEDIRDENDNVIVSGNPASVSLDIATDSDIRNAEIRQIENFHYDRIEVRGAPLRVCFTVGGSGAGDFITNSILADGWTPDQETAYETADDKGRLVDELGNVYSRLVLPLAWNGFAGDQVALPKIDTDTGQVDDGVISAYYLRDKSFDRTLPLRDPSGEQPRRPFAVYFDDDDKWHLIERPGDELTPVSLGVADDAMGVVLRAGAKPNHIQAKDVFSGESSTAAEWDFRNMLATVSMYTDEIARVSVASATPEPGENETVKIIDMPWLEVHYVVPGTVLEIDPETAGELGLTRSTALDKYPRDDSDKLRRAAYLASAWYGIIRQIATVSYLSPRPLDFLGAILDDLDGDESTVEVNTLISRVTYNLRENDQEVALETEFYDLDIRQMFRSGRGGTSANFYRSGFGDMGNIPVRAGAAGAAGAAGEYSGPFAVSGIGLEITVNAGRYNWGDGTASVEEQTTAFISNFLYMVITYTGSSYTTAFLDSSTVKNQQDGTYYVLLAEKIDESAVQVQYGDIYIAGRYT